MSLSSIGTTDSLERDEMENLEGTSSLSNIAEKVTALYEKFDDTNRRVFSERTTPPVKDQSHRPLEFISLFCVRKLSINEILAQYEHEIRSADSYFCCTTGFRIQFPNPDILAYYIHRLRRIFVTDQGWRRACMNTEQGKSILDCFDQ